jgi:molybdopterin-containing oxidoreductase family iron-sulfur binding subunit
MLCQHCDDAPCETVCPVLATVHSSEGLNMQVYNRCVGTRYCANNCPYKVRRFNFLNWHNDGVWNETGGLPETLQMQQNPNVTVRFRGVIEKCSYCVQRIQSHRLATKREGRDLRDGDIVTACQQTCPADAIVFGDLNDLGSQVSKLAMGDRRYGLLQELGIKPRTTFLAKIQNPNPEMA